MFLTILFLPLFSFIASLTLGRKLGPLGTWIITTFNLIIITILAYIIFFNIITFDLLYTININNWVDLGNLTTDFALQLDNLTILMLLPVLTVSALVHIYSKGYMAEDQHQQRFYSYLSMFTFFMILLVTASNLLLLFIGWEGVGVTSFLLINFWFTRIQANKGAMNAILINRVGDMYLTLGLFSLILIVYSIDYPVIISLTSHINSTILTIIGIFILIGAMAKSSQIGLHQWLPNSMEAPTPVSALIHAATMVTAGAYLLIRLAPLIEYSPILLIIIIWIGAITCIFAATTGLFQNDIKKIIAFSTTSQLGMLFLIIGLSQTNLALFHLINHAYFKALLFLGAGAVIHAIYDNQDIRKYGGFINFLPFTYSCLLIGSLSLMALPFLTGYYSKDLIIESAFGQFSFNAHIIYWITTIAALFTTLYSIKLLYFTFWAPSFASKVDYINAHEPPLSIGFTLTLLAIMSIFFGYLFKDLIIGLGTPLQSFIHPNNSIIIDTEFALPIIFKLLPVILTLSGFIIGIIIYEFFTIKLNLYYNIYNFFNQKYYLDLLFKYFITDSGLRLAYFNSSYLDKGSLQLFGPSGIHIFLNNISSFIATLDTGLIINYAIYIFTGLVTLISLYYIGNIHLFIVFIISAFIVKDKIYLI